MESIESLNALCAAGKMHWIGAADAWRAEADDVVHALARVTDSRNASTRRRGIGAIICGTACGRG